MTALGNEITNPEDASSPWVLQLDGIDTIADIFLNGQIIGSTSNSFIQYTYALDPKILGNSEIAQLEVRIQPALEYAAKKNAESLYDIPEVAHYNNWPEYSARQYIRKPGSDFGWDWGPAFIPAGIVKDIKLIKSSTPQISSVLVYQDHKQEAGAVQIEVNVSLTSYVPSLAGEAVVEIELENSGLPPAQLAVPFSEGETQCSVTFKVVQPKLWYPVGFGDQHLYKLRVKVIKGEEKVLNVGLRTIEVVEEEVSGSPGLSFLFRVNGAPVYIKGTNLIPIHIFMPESTMEDVIWILQSAVESNMNMIRVWGGGYYQTDEFYDLADQMGLLVWQELMFAW